MLALGLLAALITRRHSLPPYDVGLMGVFSTALVFLAAQDRGLILDAGMMRRVMVWVGSRSYALYLIHIPAFFAAREIWFRIGGPSGDLLVALTAIGILLICAELNWRFVEQPLRRYGAGIAARRSVQPAARQTA
jgi:peptidoglycan/LPS O-acetylase OafA/YrhL